MEAVSNLKRREIVEIRNVENERW